MLPWISLVSRIIRLSCFFLFIPQFNLDQQIALIIRRRLNEAFEGFSNNVLKACDYEPGAGNIPVTVIIR